VGMIEKSFLLLLSFSVYFFFLGVSHDRAGLDGDEGVGFLRSVGGGEWGAPRPASGGGWMWARGR
jgi:hypothetical protein